MMGITNYRYITFPILIGVIVFFIGLGLSPLNPMQIDWLKFYDFYQSYLGWAFYRQDSWGFPLGGNSNYGADIGSSIVFSDSIPLLAIPFKIISRFLPAPFQYFGIWLLCCFIFQGLIAWKLISHYSQNLVICFFVTFLLVFSPLIFWRIHMFHFALAGHFILLAAIYLNLIRVKHRLLAWSLVLAIAALIHFYLLVMVSLLWFGSLLDFQLSKKGKDSGYFFIEFLVAISTLFFIAWQAGYFMISLGSSADEGNPFGNYPMNALGILDSQGYSYFLSPITTQHLFEEGFNYLGLGGILLMIISLPAIWMIRSRIVDWIFRHPFYLFCLFILLLLSLTQIIYIGSIDFKLPVSPSLVLLLSLIRCSGRFFWPIYYMIILGSCVIITKVYPKVISIIIFILLLIFQLIDLSPLWMNIRDNINHPKISINSKILKNNFWNEAPLIYSNVISKPPGRWNMNWHIFSDYASQNGLATNIVLLARVDKSKLATAQANFDRAIYSGNLDSRTIYILNEWKSNPDSPQIKFDPQIDLLARMDGFNILAPGWKLCKTCPQVDPKYEIDKLEPLSIKQKTIFFGKGSEGGALFLGEHGWAGIETWGVWTDSKEAKLLLPLPHSSPLKLKLNLNAFIASGHPTQEVEVWSGETLLKKMKLTKATGNEVDIELPKTILTKSYISLEFKLLNPARPKDFGLGSDSRNLGIGLVSATFI